MAKKIVRFVLLQGLLIGLMTPAFAWHPIITLGAGTSTTSDVGASNYIPIQNPNTDQFYQYSINHTSQTSGLLEGFLGAEWQFNEKQFWQLGVDYNQAASYAARGVLTQGGDFPSSSTSYNYTVLTRQLLAAGKWLFTIKESYHPYLFAGLGESFNNASNYYANFPPLTTSTRLYQNRNTTSFSYALGLGIEIEASRQIRLGLGYRFADLGRVSLGNEVTGASGTLSQSHFYANQVLLQWTYVV